MPPLLLRLLFIQHCCGSNGCSPNPNPNSVWLYFLSPSLYCFSFLFFFCVFFLLSPSPHHHRHHTLALHLSPHNFISTQSPSYPLSLPFGSNLVPQILLPLPLTSAFIFSSPTIQIFPTFFLPSPRPGFLSLSLFFFFYYFLLSCLLV